MRKRDGKSSERRYRAKREYPGRSLGSDRYDGDDLILKRLRSQQVLGAILLVVTGCLMLSGEYHQKLMFNNTMNDTIKSLLLTLTAKNSWIVTLCLAALFELYSSFRIDARNKTLEEEKE